MRRLVPPLLVVFALCLVFAPGLAVAANGGAAEVVRLPQGTEAEALAVGPDGSLWFAGSYRGAEPANVVGKVDANGKVRQFSIPETGATLGVGGLTLGPDGNMWLTEPEGNMVQRIGPSGPMEGLVLPKPGSRPTGIVSLGGALWTTLEGAGAVLRIDPAGPGNEYSLPGQHPNALAVGADSMLWLTDADAAVVTRKPPEGRSIGFPMTGFEGTRATDIVSGPDGNLWMSESDGPYVSRMEARATTSKYVRFKLPIKGSTSLVSTGPDRDVWFAGGGRIGSIDTRGASFGAPICALPGCPKVEALAEGHEGALWFAAGGMLGKFEPAPVSVALRAPLRAQGTKKATATIDCNGGAGGQHCRGKLELLPRKGSGDRLGSGHFGIPTGFSQTTILNLSRTAAATLAQKGSLPVRLVARLDGKIAAGRNFVLHAAG
jgi:streptogramin lyase